MLLDVRHLKVHYPVRGGFFRRVVDHVKAVDDVSFSLNRGETYGLVGESGCGKTTTGRTIIGLIRATAGEVLFEGTDLTKLSRRQFHPYRKDIQMIFQDPYSSLNPRKRVLDIIAEPLRNFEKLSPHEERKKVQSILERVGLSADSIYKYPHEFSGGQRQRIGIARALMLNPKLIIADEPVSALDVSVQAQVLNFMKDIQQDYGLTYLFISHDLGIIRHMCDRIGIMYRGRLVEEGTSEDIFANPQHIYTKRLLSAIPNADPRERGKQTALRREVEQEYAQAYSRYFDETGRAYPLKPISPTHSVAIP
ncbi:MULTISPECIES: ABC transporter ATP-binding protein [Geobacillus]|uniref:ABC transporter ATP-binding protein n=1 Tax=Geobacillus thermocatenulatus TaxID=33938 RepID=A0A226Q1N9_9BACL|nr:MULTISPECIES: ATP-binding cassette domain-containing protein [Geobacillus]KPC99621.1 Oligopeptide transport ATP-binding protein OppF [Geobacillus sp. BCO2]RAN23427.1 peptide ABC transporter substrate-binding protein [Geobacillus sp. A8]ASS99811.1 ABC transporter ATP-binding protein [Geobacillus thermocatenulatus]KLR72715.1 peptide ABC transporter substrate-binding protein [Geobacillus sp. T6]OXB86191.1 ABC transporter ATP-binding protein [Geobacillus thermocatenulatus]